MNDSYINFVKEDGLIEVATSQIYFLSFIFSLIIGVQFFKQKKILFASLYLLLSTGFFFIAFEEISWSQRIFSIETPEFFKDSVQDEMNFHNLPITNDYINFAILLVGLVGFTLWVFFTHSNKLKDKSFTKFFVPQGFIMPYFISVIIFHEMWLFKQFLPQSSEGLILYLFKWPDHELVEFLLSVGIFLFIASKFLELNKKKKIKT